MSSIAMEGEFTRIAPILSAMRFQTSPWSASPSPRDALHSLTRIAFAARALPKRIRPWSSKWRER